MTRRDALRVLAGALGLWSMPAAAQDRRIATAGILTVFASGPLFKPFLDELSARGWQDGRNIRLRFLSTEGTNQGLPALVDRLVKDHADAIVAAGDPAITAAQHGAPAVPIVGITDDMVGSRLVASMARPGGHTTGISILASELDV